MQQYTLQSTEGKLLQDRMYVIQLNNGEQHYVQATSAVLSPATQTTTAITINPAEQLQHNAYLQQNQLGQIQTIQPQETAVVQPQNDSFQEVLDYIQHLYTELAKEKNIRCYMCLFCAQDFSDLRSLLRHTSFSHRTKILDGSISLEQDFEALIRKKIQTKEQQSQNQQLYQCVQCQQMFGSLEIISEHLAHCQPPSATISNVVPSSNSASYQTKASTELANSSERKSQTITDSYVPYGCAQCGRRYNTIRDLMSHMRLCQEETFYDAANHLHDKNWVEAPKNQHIVINEEATNMVLKTTGLWLMPEPPGQQIGTEALRGFWVLPSSTSEYIEHQQEKLRLEQEQKRIQEEQAEQARLQREEEEQQQQQQQRQQLLMQRQIIEEQQKLRLQQQMQEQQKQMLLQQQLQRQSQSVVQTMGSVPNTVPIVKSSPTAVISHQNSTNIPAQRPHSAATNTIIVLNDEQIFSQSGTDALRCIQASDGSYHVIGNVDLNDRQVTNATSVIAHTSPTIEPAPSTTGRKRRAGRPPKQIHNTNSNAYTQQNDSELITLENVYQTQESSVTPVTTKQTNAKRRRGQQNVDTPTITIDPNQTVIQNVDAGDIPPQQFYLAYNDNGVLVPIDTAPTLLKNDSQSTAVDLSQEQYIIEDLDASRKAQQKSEHQRNNKTTARSMTNVQSTVTTSTVTAATNSAAARVIVPDTTTSDLSAYNIDDLSHLDKPIVSEKPSTVVPIKPLKTKPQFMDSFFSFLMNRESNKL